MRQARAGHDTCGQRVTPRCRWAGGLAGQRGDAPSEARSADGSRAGSHPPAHTATRHHWYGGRRRDRRVRAGFETTHRDTHQHASRRRCGGRRRAWLRCPWAAAGPAAVPVGGGLAGLRDDAPSEARGAGGRAQRRPEHPWGHKQHKQEGRRPREQPAARPNNTPRGPTAHHAAPQATQHRGAGPQARAPSATTQTRTLRSTCVRSRSARAARRWRRSSRSPRLRRRAGPRR